MQYNSCITLGTGDVTNDDFGDICKVFIQKGVSLANTRFLYIDGSSKVFHRMPLDDQEDARRFWNECVTN